MKNLKWEFNPEFNVLEANFNAKLVSVGTDPIESNGEKKTKYHPATIQTEDGTFSGIMWQKNYDLAHEQGGFKFNSVDYLCRASVTKAEVEEAKAEGRKPRILVTISHLQGASRPSLEDFGLSVEELEMQMTEDNTFAKQEADDEPVKQSNRINS